MTTTTEQLINERRETHGDYTNTAGCAQELKRSIGCWFNKADKQSSDVPPVMIESLDMICSKIGRLVSGDHMCKDHWDDIAGYAKLVAERCE